MAGFVYVLLNPGFPGIAKIGQTERHPNERARELQTTGIPHPFVAAYWRRVDDPAAAEAKLHSMFDEYRVSQNREFFNVEVTEIIQAMMNLELANSGDPVEPDYERVSPYLYRMSFQIGKSTMAKIGVSDLPREELYDALVAFIRAKYVERSIQFGYPLFFEIDSRWMGNKILSELSEFGIPEMPGFFSNVEPDRLEQKVRNHKASVEQAEIAKRKSKELRMLERRLSG